MAVPDIYISFALSVNFCMGATHCLLPAAGPRKKPRYFAVGRIRKEPQAGMFLLSQATMELIRVGGRGTRGTTLHLMGLSVRPAANRAS